MADVIFIGIIVVFFAICVAYVRGCDRLVESARAGVEDRDDEVVG